MKITRLHIHHFGKLENLTINFGDGIHMIYGDNESGKSTLRAFINAMLFGMERGRGRAARTDEYTRWKPWNGGTSYGGVLELKKDDKIYSIYRDFAKSPTDCTIVNETERRELPNTRETMDFLLDGLTRTLLLNTLSVGQLQALPGKGLASELRNRIINLHSTGSPDLDVSGALDMLAAEKKKLRASYSEEADAEIERTDREIITAQAELASTSDGGDTRRRLSELECSKERLESEISSLSAEQRKINQGIAHKDSILARLGVGGTGEAIGLYQEVGALRDECVTDYPEDSAPKNRFGLFAGLLAVFLAIAVVCGILGALNISGPFENMPLVLFITSGAAICAAIVMIVLLVLGMRRNRTAERLRHLYVAICPDGTDVSPVRMAESLLSVIGRDVEMLERADSSRNRLPELAARITERHENLSGLAGQVLELRTSLLKTEQKEEALRKLYEKREMLEADAARNVSVKEDMDAVSFAAETISHLSKNAFSSFGSFLDGRMSELISDITHGAYEGITVSDDLSIVLRQNGHGIGLQYVSQGTMDQVYLALRLACVDFFWPDNSMPLMLDDTFAMYDGNRLTSILDWLASNYKGQIFIFTCHRREEEKLTVSGTPFEKTYL